MIAFRVTAGLAMKSQHSAGVEFHPYANADGRKVAPR